MLKTQKISENDTPDERESLSNKKPRLEVKDKTYYIHSDKLEEELNQLTKDMKKIALDCSSPIQEQINAFMQNKEKNDSTPQNTKTSEENNFTAY
jgi:hypothetical protein